MLALNIVLFHFTPGHLHYLYPVINNAYVFVGFFFLISGFVLTYNYSDRALTMRSSNFYIARFARIYPTYLLTLVISLPMLHEEWSARPHEQFWQGLFLTPFTLQGWIPVLSTFWNTVGWTVSAEVALYAVFPYILRSAAASPMWNWSALRLTGLVLTIWLVGLIPHALYLVFDPDHLPHPINRFSYGIYLRALKFSPPAYLCIFLAGGVLARVHNVLRLDPVRQVLLSIVSIVGLALFFQWAIPAGVPYVLIHGCLLLPLFSMLILGISGRNPVASLLSWKPLVRLGEATFALYLLHFNVFIIIHAYRWPERLHVAQWDPWISYVFLLVLAYVVMNLVEKPSRNFILRHLMPSTPRLADEGPAAPTPV